MLGRARQIGPVVSVVATALLARGAVPAQDPAPVAPAGCEAGVTLSQVDAAAEFARRLAALPAGDHAAALALGRWAIEQGLAEQADALFRAILDSDPDQDEAHASLWYLDGARPLVKASAAYDDARARLGETFREHETPRYVILSDADPDWVQEQGRRLERAYDRFIRFANSLDLRPRPLRHKLVAVVFSRLDDFVEYARADSNPLGNRIAGYYSPRADRLVFYHVESNENVARARAQLETLASEIDAVRRDSRRTASTGRREQARAMEREIEGKIRRHDAELQRLDAIAHQQSVSVTVHEALHQLLFHTRVQSPFVQHPLWVSEGLATAFETDDTSRPFGPGEEFWPRRERFWHLLDHGRLQPLRALVVADHGALSADGATVDALYNQSYALVTWMCRHRKPQFREYLRRLNAMAGDGAGPPQGSLTIFEEAFGDVDRLEEAWLRHERDQ